MALFYEGAQFPPQEDIERLAKYARGRKIFDGKQYEIYQRASDLLKDTPHAKQLAKLYIAVNIMDVLLVKPSDMLISDPPIYETGKPDDSREQKALNSIVEENDLKQLIREIVIGSGIRGDSWIKNYYGVRQDLSEIPDSLDKPEVPKESIIEAVDASYVFPEFSRGSRKRIKAINIAYVEEIEVPSGIISTILSGSKTTVERYLVVERHVPGYILHERYKLSFKATDTTYDVPISVYSIDKKIATGRDSDIEDTGVNRILVHHAPYKTVDDTFYGISGIEKIESVLAAINDILVQLDYILHKHSDPTAYGPELPTDTDGSIRFGGKYIPVNKDEQTPGYMTFLSSQQLDGIFKELDLLLSLIYQMSETPQWLFGTTVAGQDKGGSGTSHTDGAAIRARFMPILSKVSRIRDNVDRAVRDALWCAMMLENYANEGVDGFESYEPIYPVIHWKDGLPKNELEEAQIMEIRTGKKPTIDVKTAIKRTDNLDDMQADEIIKRIKDDEKMMNGFVDSSIFSGGTGGGN